MRQGYVVEIIHATAIVVVEDGRIIEASPIFRNLIGQDVKILNTLVAQRKQSMQIHEFEEGEIV